MELRLEGVVEEVEVEGVGSCCCGGVGVFCCGRDDDVELFSHVSFSSSLLLLFFFSSSSSFPPDSQL
jgi:hypothetical protein